MAQFFKDFGKEAKDLLTKSVAEGKADGKSGGFPSPVWKVESKLKASASGKKVVINPVADAKGIKANVEWACCDAVSGKVVVAHKKANDKGAIAGCPLTFAPTVSYSCCGRKLEINTPSFHEPCKMDITYEDKQKEYSAIVKYVDDKKTVTAEVSAAVPGLPISGDVVIGGAFVFPCKPSFGFEKWGAGLRYKPCKSCMVAITTDKFKQFDLSACGEIPGFKLEGKPVTVGTVISAKCGDKAAFTAVVGATGKVPMCPCGSSWKIKADSSANVSLTHLVDCSGWKISWTVDVMKQLIGMTATLE